VSSRFLPAEAFIEESADWELLPFRFHSLPEAILLTNLVGETLMISRGEFSLLRDRQLPRDSPFVRRLRAKHIIRAPDDGAPLQLLALKLRTRFRHLPQFTALHMFVVSLRCEHSCPYCQVSRQSTDRARFDMSEATADAALRHVFRSPSPQLKIEFQGGEPLLNFELIRYIVLAAERMNEIEQRNLVFVIATNLALLDDAIIAFARDHRILFSTSLDGPADLHNKNRPRPGHDSWERAVSGIRVVQEELGRDRVSALMTTTKHSLDRAHDIIDTYVELGLHEIFLRPLSPYGFAMKTRSFAAYDTQRWLDFYFEGLRYIIELNRGGRDIAERYAAILLKKILTNDDPRYVDLTSPSGIGIGALVYNYDGRVYASDEGRMLAEMGDDTFCLGTVNDSYPELLLSDALLNPLESSFAPSAPMCSDCAIEPFCGSDPVYHHATTGDYLGIKPESGFCMRNMTIAERLLTDYDREPALRPLFLDWASR
jgi:uncharacterized protein